MIKNFIYVIISFLLLYFKVVVNHTKGKKYTLEGAIGLIRAIQNSVFYFLVVFWMIVSIGRIVAEIIDFDFLYWALEKIGI
jgi:hypothetical protein